jgi:hypothetical protein
MGERLTLKEAAERSSLSTSMLARLLKSGRIQGEKSKTQFIEVWYVDVDSLAAYPASRQKPGPKPGTRRKQEIPEGETEAIHPPTEDRGPSGPSL